MAESPNPSIDLRSNSVRVKCPREDCKTSVSVHSSMREQISTFKCREHGVLLEIVEEHS